MGDVYPPATISAGGNLVVMGKAQGKLIAGTKLGESAIIIVGKFATPYIQIGKYKARQEVTEDNTTIMVSIIISLFNLVII